MKTERLYYEDSHMQSFEAKVLSCTREKDRYAVIFDRTAFFPEGGGQLADTGLAGEAKVLDVQIKDGEIVHYTDRALTAGEKYHCSLDWEQRLRRMQSHSGEHIVSGLVHRLYGYDNVGFHMGENMTIDFNGELSWDELMKVEQLANEAVRKNVPLHCFFPDSEELKTLDYRSKLELTEDVRIVEIEGYDRCACCAPHVSRTGEIGIIKIQDFMRHRGGVRVNLICGMDALDDYRKKQDNAAAISSALSVKRDETAAAVERLLAERQQYKDRIAELSGACAELLSEAFPPDSRNICAFDRVLDEVALRELTNKLMDKCSGIAAVFSGSDREGYKYIIGSKNINLRAAARDINSAINGRGGGSPEMIQGRASASEAEIRSFIENFEG